MVHLGRGWGLFGRCFGSLGEMLCLILGDVVAHWGYVWLPMGEMRWLIGEMLWLIRRAVVSH